MNVSFDELLAMAFEQRSSKPRLQCMTSGQISSGLDLTYAPSTITTQQPTDGELDSLFEAMYDDYFGGQLSASVENVSPVQEPQVRQTSTASTTIADNVPIPTNSSSHATNIPITSQDVDELNPNAMGDGNTFVNPFPNSSTSAAIASSSSQNVDPSNMHTERLIEGPELIEITNEKVAVAKEKLKEARSRQKSYADKHRRDLEFQVGDRVFLKVSPFRGVKRFGIKGKLSPRFIGPFEILERIGESEESVDFLEKKITIPEGSEGRRRDEYGIDGFGLGFGVLTGAATGSAKGATTGSKFGIGVSTWTTGGWTSLVLPLFVGGTMSFVTSVSRSTTLGGEEVVGIVGPFYEFPLRVVIPFKSSFRLVMVLLGRVPRPEDDVSQLVVEVSELDESELVGDFISELRHHRGWKVFSEKHFSHLLKCVDRITWQTIKPSSGMMCQGVRKEIQTKGIIGDPIHFDTLAIGAIGPPRPCKFVWHNSFIVQRSGTGGSPFPLVAILKSFKRVGSTRDLLQIVSSGLSRGEKRFLAD
nr:putative nucleotidyltransferase, ribonuclease H [Tanacetum cinerariifolium]